LLTVNNLNPEEPTSVEKSTVYRIAPPGVGISFSKVSIQLVRRLCERQCA